MLGCGGGKSGFSWGVSEHGALPVHTLLHFSTSSHLFWSMAGPTCQEHAALENTTYGA